MLADIRGRYQSGIGLRRNPGGSWGAELSHAGLVDSNRTAGGDDVRVGEPVVETVDPVGEDIRCAHSREPAGGRVGREDGAEDFAEWRGVAGARCEIGKARIGGEIGPAERAYETALVLAQVKMVNSRARAATPSCSRSSAMNSGRSP